MGNTSNHKGYMKILWAGVLLIFLLVSIIFIKSPLKKMRSEFRAAELEQVTTVDGKKTRTDYLNHDGVITIAADKGYASKIITKTEEGEYEEYLDEKGNSISTYSGYYAVFRKYDEFGNNVRATYLDNEGEPILTDSGYASILKEFDEEGRTTVTRYFDIDGTPILTAFGYAKANEYNEDGDINRITYLGINDRPIVTSQGYASLSRTFYMTEDQNKGRVENEFYFDTEGNPTKLSLGQYGVHKEYDENGKEAVITYLDATGLPLLTNKGFFRSKTYISSEFWQKAESYF